MPPSSARPVAALLLAAALAACTVTPANPAKIDPATIDTRPSPAVRYATGRISPAVVQLNVTTEEFYDGQARTSQSTGSGFIIDNEGHVLTNFHVAGRAKRIDITLANLEHVKATLIGSDHWTDLALVQLDLDDIRRRNLTFDVAALGVSSDVMLAQPVMAVGTPYGLSRTVTAGIVSQTDRWIDESSIDGYETGWFNNWIQTDAAINPGNSGGPLINLRGEVIGINTRAISAGNNLGFAIPIDTAKKVIPELLSDRKKVARSYVGISLQPLQDFENHFDIAGNQGVLISNVDKASPAQDAGLEPGDILMAVDDHPVSGRFPEQISGVRKLIADYPVDSKVTLSVRRVARGSSATAPATATAPAATSRTEGKTFTVTTDRLESVLTEQKAITAWGMTVRELTHAYLRRASLYQPGKPWIQGVLVTGVRIGQPASNAKLLDNDIIISVNDKKVTSLKELTDAVAEWEKNKRNIAVEVIRNRPDASITLSLKP
jgi:serine protease Do